MIDLEDIFHYKKFNDKKLLAYGFVEKENDFVLKKPILSDELILEIRISRAGEVSYSAFDSFSGDEYLLLKIDTAQGTYPGKVREETENLLKQISEHCFDIDVFRAQQTVRLFDYIKQKYEVVPEFPWEEKENCIFRHNDSPKWFAVVLRVEGTKISPEKKGKIEIVDFKARPEKITEIIDGVRFYPGYHMNKKHWFTIVLDGSVQDEELFSFVDESFSLTVK